MATIQPGTLEMPMTASMRQVVSRDAAKVRTSLLIVCGILGGVLILLGLALQALVFVAIGLVMGIGIYLLGWLVSRLTMGRDVNEKSFLRTTGPMHVSQKEFTDTNNVTTTTYQLSVGDRHFTVDKRVAAVAGQRQFGTVDHSKHGHIVFEIRDDTGQSVYRHDGYVPAN